MNKHLIPEKSKLFRNKLEKLIESIYRSREASDLQTQEAYVLEAVKILSLYYRNITETNFNVRPIIAGTFPSMEDYNNNFLEILDDLIILFAELENLEGVVLEHFNLVTAQANRLNSRVKRLSSAMTDYALYSNLPLKNGLYFSDTFSDLSKIESSSNLLNATECNINQAEGTVTLPVNTGSSTTLSVTNSPLINSNSNGRSGNNEQVGVTQVNNEISVILDNNPDTWFEYERVVQVDDGEELVLDFTINIGKSEIINFIRVNPNNFGTKTEIEIIDISTSADGEIYLSVKDDIPITGFTVEDEDNVFKLAASTSKYAGQGLYTFTPRYAKYVRLTLKQSTPYPISTVQGTQLRYAIGIRDVEIQRQAYDATGEVVSAPFTTSDEIKKVALTSSQTPLVQSELANIVHQISVDEGNTWHTVQPLEQDAITNVLTEAEEVLNINTEDANSIQTEAPVTTIRYKAILSRDAAGFTNGSSSFAETIVSTTETKSLPQSDPFEIVLENTPVLGSVSVLDASYGSRGHSNNRYILGTGSSAPFRMPWDKLPFDFEKTANGVQDNLIYDGVFVDGVEWTQVPDFSGSIATDKHYTITTPTISVGTNFKNLERAIQIDFGDGTNGKKPDSEATIELAFTPERIYPTGKDEHIATLGFPTTTDKSDVVITRYGNIESEVNSLTPRSRIHRLQRRYLVNEGNIRFSGVSLLQGDRQTFRNGQQAPIGELTGAGEWSVDTERGIIYTYDETGEVPGTVRYQYQSQQNISTAAWDWVDDSTPARAVKILEDGWVTEQGLVSEVTYSGVRVNLPNLSVVEGTLEFTLPAGTTEANNPFLEEVPFTGDLDWEFANARPELSTVIRTEQNIPNIDPPGNIATFTLNSNISDDDRLAVAFDDNDVFVTDVSPSTPASVGEYKVDRSTNTIEVHTDGADLSDAGKVYYYAYDPSRVAQGAYTVDYARGIVYTQRPMPSTDIQIKYQYTDYRIRYDISREIPETDARGAAWQLDPTTKTISFFSKEILDRLRISSLSSNQQFKPLLYQVSYRYIATVRQSIEELEPYFSPVLKDYALKVVTKGNL